MIGKNQEIPTRYNMSSINNYDTTTSSCTTDIIDFLEVTTGSVKKGPGSNEYLMDIDGVYYTFSQIGLTLYGCEGYHTAGVEFDLMTSECPVLQDFKEFYEFGVFYSNYIDFYDTHMVQLGTTFPLISDNGCEADPLPPVDDGDNGSSAWIIILIVVIVIIVIIVLVVILLLKKKGGPELKVTPVSKTPEDSQTQSKPTVVNIPSPQPAVLPNVSYPQPVPNMTGPQPVVLIPIGAAQPGVVLPPPQGVPNLSTQSVNTPPSA